MVKCGVLFEVRTESLNTIYTTFEGEASDTQRNSKFRCLSEATPITITSSLSHYSYQKDERAPYNKMVFLPPRKINCLSLHPLISSLNLLFIYPSRLSLSFFDFKGLMGR
jgi:hypothetical protein